MRFLRIIDYKIIVLIIITICDDYILYKRIINNNYRYQFISILFQQKKHSAMIYTYHQNHLAMGKTMGYDAKSNILRFTLYNSLNLLCVQLAIHKSQWFTLSIDYTVFIVHWLEFLVFLLVIRSWEYLLLINVPSFKGQVNSIFMTFMKVTTYLIC